MVQVASPSPSRRPSLAECIRLMQQYAMLPNICHHSLVVARIAEQLRVGLCIFTPDRQQAERTLVITGALLHDIAKTPCLHTTRNHAQEGAEICRQHNFYAIADIVAHHVILSDYDPERYQAGYFTAEELVYYADKRVLHAEVAPLDQRLAYILKRYSKDKPERQALIRENFVKCLVLEEHLFRFLPFTSDTLGRF